MSNSDYSDITNLFEYISPKFLLGNLNVVIPDWGGTDYFYDFYKFYYFLDGQAEITIFNEIFYPKPGELFIIPPYTKHSYSQNSAHPIYLYWCHFDLSINLNRVFTYSKETIKCTPKKDTIVPLFNKLLANVSDNSLEHVLMRKSCILELLAIFFKNIELSKVLQFNNEFYNTINKYITENINNVIHINNLANIVHLQPNYFISVFKNHFHISPIKYINILRLKNAANLLISNPDIKIEQIALQNGFRDYRYFGRIFKKHYGLTPSQYRTAKMVSGISIQR